MKRHFELSTAARLGDPWLAPTSDLSRARLAIAHYDAPDSAQREAQRRMLAFLDAHPSDAHLRTLLEGHLTASALVVDSRGERALLTHHRKLGRWLQLGGHCDGDANLAGVALREAVEESGIAELAVLPTPIDLDVHPIPARPGEPGHVHYDTRFVVVAPQGAVGRAGDESHELRWFTPAELASIEADASVRRLFEIVLG